MGSKNKLAPKLKTQTRLIPPAVPNHEISAANFNAEAGGALCSYTLAMRRPRRYDPTSPGVTLRRELTRPRAGNRILQSVITFRFEPGV